MPNPTLNVLPRWRGFNLLDFFTVNSTGDLSEDDLRWMRDWGLDFVRLPLCYLLWVQGGDPYQIDEPMLAKIDRAVDLGRRYNIHINLSFHRAPGYSVNPERTEPFDLWHDQAALDAFAFHWQLFATRYRGIPSAQLSFNLVNEPPAPGYVALPTYTGMTLADHQLMVVTGLDAVRSVDPDRLVIIDGVDWGRQPCPDLAALGVAQSCRAYAPMGVSHYMAPWVGGQNFPPPAWPGGWNYGQTWYRSDLEAFYAPWAGLAASGVGVHCGEGGAYNRTPHNIVLRWYRDVLEILTGHAIGHALWNLRGDFGVLDSGRTDVAYEDWHGHKLDRQLLALLQEF